MLCPGPRAWLGGVDSDVWQDRIRTMSEERSWTGYHSPKNLAMALSVEVAELVEIFQWLTEEESRAVMERPERAKAVQDEVADVMTYLLRLADVLELDLEEAMATKLAESERRYPVGSAPSGLGEGVIPSPPEPLAITRVVLGVAVCEAGWVGALLEPSAPRPRVVVASGLEALLETVREQVTPSVVGVPDDLVGSEEVVALARRQRELTFVGTQGAPFASLDELKAAGLAAPSVLRGSGYGPQDVLAACTAGRDALLAGR